MSKPVDLDKLRSIGSLSSGYKKTKKVERRHDGEQTYHWDGRVDAHVRAKAVKVRTKTNEE